MIKDMLVNLSLGRSHDRARDYAVSLAEMLDAHLTAISFSYDPIVPMAAGVVVIPAELIDAQSITGFSLGALPEFQGDDPIGKKPL